ncbi:hypothetical protein LINPERPRIM_LOCUS1650 [Linum perenne]
MFQLTLIICSCEGGRCCLLGRCFRQGKIRRIQEGTRCTPLR